MRVADCQACIGCPIRGDGSPQFVGDQVKPGAPVHLVTDQVGDSDPVKRVAQYIKLAGLEPGQISSGSAIRCTADLPKPVTSAQFEAGKRGVLENAVRFCDRAHGWSRANSPGVSLVVAQGDLALYAATGQRSAHEWRGWLLPYQSVSDGWLSVVWQPGPSDTPVLATVPMSDLRAMPTLTYGMRADWTKVGRVLRGEWPQPLPAFESRPPTEWPRLSAFDTEFNERGEITRYSLYDGRVLRVVEAQDTRKLETSGKPCVIMHNIEADILHLERFLSGAELKVEDSMLAHAALYSDLPHSLEYLGSLYARTNRWKHLFHRAPRPYSAGDAIGTWDVWFNGLIPEFKADPASAKVYREELFPLTGIIMEAERVGLRLDQGRIGVALDHHAALRQEVIDEVQAYAGYPLVVSSADQVQRHLYEVERVGVKQRRRNANNRAK